MNVYLLSLNPEASARKQWDFGLLQQIFDDLGYDYSKDYKHLETGMPGGIVVLPARHHAGLETQVNAELLKLPFVKLFLIGDEEASFKVEALSHPNIEITVQNPRPPLHNNYYKLGTGFPGHLQAHLPTLPVKDLDYFFSGQITHSRRQQLADNLTTTSAGYFNATAGFTQGLEPSDYYQQMARAKVALCPSGPELPDTFRLFEALEMGCVPIADEITPKQDFVDYWTWFFNEEPPFSVIRDYQDVNGWIKDLAGQYPTLNNDCQAWWYRQKWQIKDRIFDQKLTVVIPVSPIKSHPSTEILDETIASIIHHLPSVKIIVSFDGVRAEQQDLLTDYQQHIRAVLWKHRDIYPVIFSDHQHQVGMMRQLLQQHISTPMIMYVEQDTPLEKEFIDFTTIYGLIETGYSNLVRLSHESEILPEHQHMMLGNEGDYTQTVQWSQRPHIASSAFYKRVMQEFSPEARCFIEDKMHGVVWNAYVTDGKLGYNQWRLHIYTPEGNIRRSYHTDGRQGAAKYDDTQRF
jgi:hypothetical protein